MRRVTRLTTPAVALKLGENMSDQFTENEQADFFDPTGNGKREEDFPLPDDGTGSETFTANYDALINAPDYSTIIKGSRTATAREYETKVKSVLKSGAIGALRRGNLPDSAAIFRHGPAFAAAVGDLAEVSEQTRRMVDLATAPENPYVMLLIAGIPLVAQLFRNHQPEIQEVARSRRAMRKYRKEHPEEFIHAEQREDKRRNVEIRLPLGRRITFRLGLKINPFKGIRFAFRTQTREPAELVTMVFSDKKLVAALKKQGIDIVQVPL
jgi:hypothetical protein